MFEKIFDSFKPDYLQTIYQPSWSNHSYDIAVKFNSAFRVIFTLYIDDHEVIKMVWFSLSSVEKETIFENTKIKMITTYSHRKESYLVEIFFNNERAAEFTFGRYIVY